MARDRKTFPVQLKGEITVETAKSYKFFPIDGDDDFFVWVPKSNIDAEKSTVRPDSAKSDSVLWVTEWWYGVSGIHEKKQGLPPPPPKEKDNMLKTARGATKRTEPDDDDEIPF